jgi:TfoX/Sxy family transcriptional regulator of competence genes
MMDDKTIIENIEKTLQEAILNVKPEVMLDYKRMFGGAGYYADGKIFAAWFGKDSDTIALKLSAEDTETLLQVAGAKKALMGGYVEIPAAWLQNVDELLPWIAKSLNYVASIPAKKKKSKS